MPLYVCVGGSSSSIFYMLSDLDPDVFRFLRNLMGGGVGHCRPTAVFCAQGASGPGERSPEPGESVASNAASGPP